MSLSNGSDLALELPLQGVQLIEASAGTGKTHTLAGIYTRLIVECRFAVRQILVVTFTKAATEELKSRLRARLLLCAEVAAELHRDAAPSAELEQSRALVERALRDEAATALQTRLRLASLELDSAQISTIHGFCQRALREHAFFAGAAVDGELVASDRDLLETIAADLWREHAVATDADGFAAFAQGVGSAAQFGRLLPTLLDTGENLLPRAESSETQARAVIAAGTAAETGLAHIWRTHGAQAFDALSTHALAGHVNATSYPLKKIQQHAAIFAQAFADGTTPEIDLLERYATASLDSSKCIKKNKLPLPRQIFFNAIANALVALHQVQAARRDLGLHLLRESIAKAQYRLDAIKHAARRFSYDDLIRRLYQALSGPHAETLTQALHTQYPCALVDEFQDTDTQQFAIFKAIYRGRGSLILIGDPKQAIYRFRGSDIHAYLAARARADGTHSLTENFRSTPGYLQALDRLYTFSGNAAFADTRIRYELVHAGDKRADDDLLIDGQSAVPLTFWQTQDDVGNKADATERLAEGCAAAILNLLIRARAGRAQLRDTLVDGTRGHRALQPRDLAVLVNEHKEAAAMQKALSALRVPSVCVSKRSVFATDEACELHMLLDALIELDEARLRAALSTVLFGNTLADFAKLATTSNNARATLVEFALLRQIWDSHGVLAMLERVFERRAADVLALESGERRMTNWLQLADLAQAASARVFGLRGLADWLRQRIARADDDNEDEQLRLESDADRVQVRTVHASKGLEYPIVFLPFAALRRGEQHTYPKLLRFNIDNGGDDNNPQSQPVAYLVADKLAAETPDAQAARTRANEEDMAERLRVLYVGLTRACQACFVATGVFGKGGMPPALLHLLGVDLDNNDKAATAASLAQRLNRLIEAAPASIALAALPGPSDQRWQSPSGIALGRARHATRKIVEQRGLYSFSRLSAGVHGAASVGDERAGNDDEQAGADTLTTTPLVDVPAALRGTRFGTAFHEILEKVDFAAWRDWHGPTPPTLQRDLVERTLQRHALVGTRGDDDRATLQAVTRLVAAALNSPLPFGARLCDLTANQYRAEMPFHFAIDNADAARWLQQMHAHGYLCERTRFVLDAPRLAGLMTGVLDLVVFHNDQWWVIDYKTNVLGPTAVDYVPTRLIPAVRGSEYDLQYLIYLVALHRWLKSRLGAAYDYRRDIGGALYLFVRGMDTQGVNGIHNDCPPGDLIEALDKLLAPGREAAA